MNQLSGCRLLVADAHEDTRLLVEAFFESQGARVYSAASGIDALQQFILQSPDVVICDVALPGFDGYALLHQIRKSEMVSQRRTPIIAVTGWCWAVPGCTGSEKFDAWFLKPINLDDLMAQVIRLTQFNRSWFLQCVHA